MGNRGSSYEDRYQSRKPTSAYSRHSGGDMGSYSHCNGRDSGHDHSVFIGRQRLTKPLARHRFYVSEITVPELGKVLLRKCGNEGRHRYLDEAGRATLKFLRASITFVPYAMDAGADMRNASFIFAQPGGEFVIIAGNGDWEFYFSQNNNGDICGHCVRKPMLRYIWDGVRRTVCRVGSFLLPIMGPPLLALLAA